MDINWSKSLSLCYICCSNLVVSNGAQIIEHWMQSNLRQDELSSIGDSETVKYSLSLKQEISLKMTKFYGSLLRRLFDGLLGTSTGCESGRYQIRVDFESQTPDFTLIGEDIVSSLYQVQEVCFGALEEFCGIEHVQESKTVIQQHLSMHLQDIKKRVILLDRGVSCTEDFTSATYYHLADVLSDKCDRVKVKSSTQISASINVIEACSNTSFEVTMNKQVKEEIYRRAEDLRAKVQTTNNECKLLKDTINDMLSSQTNYLGEDIETVTSSVREKIVDLETAYDFFEYSEYMLKRYEELLIELRPRYDNHALLL